MSKIQQVWRNNGEGTCLRLQSEPFPAASPSRAAFRIVFYGHNNVFVCAISNLGKYKESGEDEIYQPPCRSTSQPSPQIRGRNRRWGESWQQILTAPHLNCCNPPTPSKCHATCSPKRLCHPKPFQLTSYHLPSDEADPSWGVGDQGQRAFRNNCASLCVMWCTFHKMTRPGTAIHPVKDFHGAYRVCKW